MPKAKTLDIVNNETIENNLLFYNIVFFYHSESISLIDYYLKNTKTMIDKIKSTDKVQIVFNFILFVSNLDQFIKDLQGHLKDKFTNPIRSEIIIENDTNQIELNSITIKINNVNLQVKSIKTKPNTKIEQFINSNNELKDLSLNYGVSSIGYKRYCANILTFNIHEHIKKLYGKLYGNIRTFLLQIDFGTFIGMPAMLHKDITKMLYTEEETEIDLLNSKDNPLFTISNYWYCNKQFLAKEKTNICANYKIQENITDGTLENIYSDYDFYYFLIAHISSVLNNFNIINFTTLGIHSYDKNKLVYKGEQYVYSGFPNIRQKITQLRPKNKIEKGVKYTNITKGHYDKFYILDITLTKIKYNKTEQPLTYNKNYTSFGEDILYTKMLSKISNLVIPHPFLAISKCKDNLENPPKVQNNKPYELIYMLLPFDDVNNLKSYELDKWIKKSDPGVSFEKQDYQIDEFKKLHIGGNIECNISFKTNTKIYTEKLNAVKDVYAEHSDTRDITYHQNDKLKLIIFYDKNIKNFKDLSIKKEDYNSKYKFNYNKSNESNYLLLEKDNSFDYSNNITEYIKNYLINGTCKEYNGGNYYDKYYDKYIKYKLKYFNLKKNLIN
jgi:hypothetical protein